MLILGALMRQLTLIIVVITDNVPIMSEAVQDSAHREELALAGNTLVMFCCSTYSDTNKELVIVTFALFSLGIENAIGINTT